MVALPPIHKVFIISLLFILVLGLYVLNIFLDKNIYSSKLNLTNMDSMLLIASIHLYGILVLHFVIFILHPFYLLELRFFYFSRPYV